MSNRHLKQALTEITTYLNENPNVDNVTRSRLQLLRDQLVNFTNLDGQQIGLIEDTSSLEKLTEVIEEEIVAVGAKHPELTRKLDAIMRSLARTGI